MIAVLKHHLLHLPAGDVLPRAVSYMLPARYLGEDQKTHFVAGVDEGLGLRIVGGPDRVASELLLEDPGVFYLKAVRNCITDVGVALMPVQSAHEGLSAVQVETVCFETGSPETERNGLAGAVIQRHAQVVHDGELSVPGAGIGNGDRDPAAVHRHGCADVPAAVRYLKGSLGRGTVRESNDRIGGVKVRSRHEYIGNINALSDIQPYRAVNAAIGQIVYHESEGRYGRILCTVEFYGELYLVSGFPAVGQFYLKCGVAAEVGQFLLAVHEDCRDMSSCLETDKYSLARCLIRDDYLSAVAADHLIVPVVGIVQGEFFDSVRDPDCFSRRGEFKEIRTPLRGEFPSVIDRYHLLWSGAQTQGTAVRRRPPVFSYINCSIFMSHGQDSFTEKAAP